MSYILKACSLFIAIGIFTSCIKNTQNPKMDSGSLELSNSKVKNINNGIFIPDGKGDFIWSPGTTQQNPNEEIIQAQELRLKVKELAAQLFETRNNDALMGIVALPTSFVNLNNFSESSSLGRYMSEAMIYEFNQRGFPIKEYRLDSKINIDDLAKGEFALKRTIPPLSVNQQKSAILIGTYLKENNTIFINIRLIRASDGLILRTAQTILYVNPLINQMTKKVNNVPPKPRLPSGTININSKKNTVPNTTNIPTKQDIIAVPQNPILQPPILEKTDQSTTEGSPTPGFAKNL